MSAARMRDRSRSWFVFADWRWVAWPDAFFLALDTHNPHPLLELFRKPWYVGLVGTMCHAFVQCTWPAFARLGTVSRAKMSVFFVFLGRARARPEPGFRDAESAKLDFSPLYSVRGHLS